MITNVTIGADIEVFLKDKAGKFISSVGLIGGSKDNPRKLSEKGHAVQEDNVTAEFNIPAVTNSIDFCKEILFSLNGLKNLLPENLEIAIQASATFEQDQLQTPEAQEFGCAPDYNAYSLEENPAPNCLKHPGLRSTGGHIHIGYKEPDLFVSQLLIFNLDLFLGLPSLLLDEDVNRRQLYGKAGAFRIKDYGVEYRTLSSFWIKSEEMMKWVFANVFKAIDMINTDQNLASEERDAVRDCINNNDKETAYKFIELLNIPMPASYKPLKITV